MPDGGGPPAGPDHRSKVGGLWEVIGPLQLEFLLSEGLQQGDDLLDVGCGSLRGGIHLVRHLDSGRYVGLDADAGLLTGGRLELAQAGLDHKAATLRLATDFDVRHLGRAFRFALAHSLFTHLHLNSILRCLFRVRQVLAQDGRFYATFFESPTEEEWLGERRHPLPREGKAIVTFPDRNPYHYPFHVLAALGPAAGLDVTYIGEWGHPRGQRMLRFDPIAGTGQTQQTQGVTGRKSQA